ncbi:MAG: hypothetical protein ACKVOE_10795 [Rickettsiales bacterium]
MLDTAITILGLSAPPIFLYAYLMVSLGRWPSTAIKFHMLNLLGGLFILLSLTRQWNLSVCILEICWCSISAYGIWKATRNKT